MIKWHNDPRNGVMSGYNKDMNKTTSTKGLNIEITSGQYDMLVDLVMSAYDLDIADMKGWGIQTFDNMVDNVMAAKSTYLSTSTKGILKK